MIYIATFFSHFGAVRFKKYCDTSGWQSKIMPVPRDLSSSCGTCVRFEGECPTTLSDEIEKIVAVENGKYRILYQAENS